MLKKEKKIVSLFVAIVALLSLFSLPQQTSNVQAAGVERPNVAMTRLTMLHEDGSASNTFKYWETIKLDLAWDASMYRNTLKEGDYFTIKLPDGLRFGLNTSATHFNVVNRDNVVTANVEVTPVFTGGGTAKVVFTKAVENKYNITGEMAMFGEFVFEKIKSGDSNKFSVDVNGKVVTTEVDITKQEIDPTEVVTKWSARTTNPSEATWTMRLNYNKARTYTNVVLSDMLTAKNGSLAGIHYVDGSFILRRVEVDSTGMKVKELDRKNISNDVKFNADKTAFTYTMGTVDQNSQYYLDYKTTYVTNVILENKISFVSTEFSKEVTAQYRDFNANGRSDGNDTASMKLVKVDADNLQVRLPGATFKITEVSTQDSWTMTTDAQGEITLVNLVPGQYKIEEIAVPQGYVLDPTAKFVDLAQGEVKTVQLTNKKETPPTGKIEVVKTDSVTKSVLAGAEFDVKDAKGAVVAHLVTDATGHALTKDLPLGKYTVVETKAPKGYVLSKVEEAVTITTNGEVKTIQLTNEKEVTPTGKIEIVKTDSVTKSVLEGAEFDVKDANGTVVAHLVTDVTGHALTKDLPLGKYTVIETKAPIGFVLSQTEDVVNITKQGEVVKIEKMNKPESGKIIVSKFDQETKNRLSGMVFKVRHVDSGNEKTVDMKEFNVMELQELPLGTYEITEVTAPAGYERSTTVYKVVLEKDGDEKHLDIFDTRQTQTPKPPVEKEKSKTTTNVISLPQTGAQMEAKASGHAQYFIASGITALAVLSTLVYMIQKRKI